MIYRKVKVIEKLFENAKTFECATLVIDEEVTDILPRGTTFKTLVYKEFISDVNIGDILLVEASALAKKLGTGGFATAIANLSVKYTDFIPETGHIVKARYMPLQKMVTALDEQDSPYHDILKDAESIDGLPVIVADLHSALPAVLAGIATKAPSARVVYIMSDGAALPISFSRNVVKLMESGWLYKTITCGQSFGGDGETINIYTALLAAKLVYKADIVIVSQGPGNAGTGTKFGFSGMQCADIINAVGVLEGTPIMTLRMSNADMRPRHYGISHHSLTVLEKAVTCTTHIPVPVFDTEQDSVLVPGNFSAECADSLAECLDKCLAKKLGNEHYVIPISTAGVYEQLYDLPVKLSTMGRGLEQDYSSFASACISGIYAGNYLNENFK